jgi:hypothetical protein
VHTLTAVTLDSPALIMKVHQYKISHGLALLPLHVFFVFVCVCLNP